MTLPGTVRVVLLDIEGTTTPIAFVHERLFGYVRSHLAQYVASHWNDPPVRDVIRQLNDERASEGSGAITDPDTLLRVVHELMDRDRKSGGLKTLQGLIWEDGYQAGELRGEVWDDVPVAMRQWRSDGREIAIYSSGSELAQRRLFGSTVHGDLTTMIAGFFDTTVGPKQSASSYVNVASRLAVEPAEILFVSDVTAELAAAADAGCATVLSLRPGNLPQPDAAAYPHIQTFDEILP